MKTRLLFLLTLFLVVILVAAVGIFGSLNAVADNPPPVSAIPEQADNSGLDSSSLPSGDVLAGEQALSEVSTDVNPNDSDNRVIVGHAPSLTTMNTFYTLDGITWNFVPLGSAQDGLTSNFRFDPTVAFDDAGNVYAGYGVRTAGPNKITVMVAKSLDGGATYTQFTSVSTTNDIGGLPGNDKFHLATGPDPGNLANPMVCIAWTQNVQEPGVDQRIVASCSTNGGANFSAPVILNDASIAGTSTGNLFADPAIGPNGDLNVAWNSINTAQVLVDVSPDGGTTWGTDSLVTTSGCGFKTSIPAQVDRGIFVGPTIDTDRSGGAFDGRLHVTYCDLGAGGLPNTDTFARYSDDLGATWSAPALVNDDGGDNSQFLPWLDVDQATGMVSVVWYDARNDVNNQKVETFLSVSNDGGASFQPNIQVADAKSNMSNSNAFRYLGNFLEYIGVATFNCEVFPVWSDNSMNPADLDYFTDQVLITDTACNFPLVADAVPPVMTVPTDITVECETIGGTDISNPAIQAFLSSASASDIVDPSPTITNDAPSFCPLGDIVVTFTATDASGNSSSGTAIITVVDTTPPEVTAALVPVGETDDDENLFRVEFSCSDICDEDPIITSAVLVVDGTEIPVTNGQMVELELDDEVEVEEEDGILEIEAPSFELVVTCEDESGNVAIATAMPPFAEDDDGEGDDDDEDSDDDDDD